MTDTMARLTGYRRHLPVRWWVAGLFAVAIAYADGLWLTSFQDMVGAIDPSQAPSTIWLRDSTLILPPIVLVVLIALLLARCWRRRLASLAASAVMISLLSSGVSLVKAEANATDNAASPQPHMQMMGVGRPKQPAADTSGFGPAVQLPYTLYCNLRGVETNDPVSLLEYATSTTSQSPLSYLGLPVLLTNLVVVGALLALWHDDLWEPDVSASPNEDEIDTQPNGGGMSL